MVMTDIESNVSILVYIANINQFQQSHTHLPFVGTRLLNMSAILKKITLNTNLMSDINQLEKSMTRSNRVFIWKKILEALDISIEYLTQRGYGSVVISENKSFSYNIEKTEPCCITNVAAPYTNLHLLCGHELSTPCIY